MDVFGQMIAVVLTAYMIFIQPVQYMVELQEEALESYVDGVSKEFVNHVCKQGKLLRTTYESFIKDLNRSGYVYEVELRHAYEMIGVQPSQQEESEVSLLRYETTIDVTTRQLERIEASLSSTTISKYTSIPLEYVILYYDDGTTEIVEEGWTIAYVPVDVGGTYPVVIQYTKHGITCETIVMITVENLTTICDVCEQSYFLTDEDLDEGCPICTSTIDHIEVDQDMITVLLGESLNLHVTAVYNDGRMEQVTDWTSDYNSALPGGQVVTISYDNATTQINVNVISYSECNRCGQMFENSKDLDNNLCSLCEKQVQSIEVSPSYCEVSLDGKLEVAVLVTYEDGTTETVQDYTSNFNSQLVGTQVVDIYYGGKTASLVVEVTKESTWEICPYCNESYDTEIAPAGCLACKKEIVVIVPMLIQDGNQVQLGCELDIKLILEFRDGHREMRYDGYRVEGYRSNVLGIQIIVVYYEEHTATIEIEVIQALRHSVCEQGHSYPITDGEEEMECPYCASKKEATTATYWKVVYSEDIIEKLYRYGIYNLNEGDSFHIVIKRNRMKTRISFVYIKPILRLRQQQTRTYGGVV